MRFSQFRRIGIMTILALAATGATAGSAMAYGSGGDAVYTQTNDPAGNGVQKFDRAADGTLSPAGSFASGGQGLAGLGGRQGAVELSDDGRSVYAINAGSNTVSTFRVTRDGLRLVDIDLSGGTAPVSVDEHGGRVYVLNSGGTANVTAFRSRPFGGGLMPIPGGSRDLPGAQGAAQVSVAPNGDELVVSERLSNRLETLSLDSAGRPGAPVVTPSSGAVPFGFAFGRDDQLVVSEAGASTVSSYRVERSGALNPITASAPVNQGAACWVAITPGGRYAYTGNASGSISGYRISRSGALTALNADGLTARPAQSPRDLDVAGDGRFLYAVSPGNTTAGGSITGYRVGFDGSLTQITNVPAAAGITGAAAS